MLGLYNKYIVFHGFYVLICILLIYKYVLLFGIGLLNLGLLDSQGVVLLGLLIFRLE